MVQKLIYARNLPPKWAPERLEKPVVLKNQSTRETGSSTTSWR
jgi:hypothetical protein